MNRADTIVAVSSAPGRSGRGLVRVSGGRTGEILKLLGLGSVKPRAAERARLVMGAGALPVMVAWFAGPGSYTGEDMAEIQLPGNPALLDRVVHRAIECGARLAEPGEFTWRAFAAGKMDLPQAEGVAATIAAVSDAQLQAAALLRHGRLGQLAESLVKAIAEALALVEAGIDFTDQDDVTAIDPRNLRLRVGAVLAELDDLLAHSRSWGALEALPRVVLVGAPSTGKSTLFNALLGRERAVMSPTPGTTRDVIEEPLRLGNVEVMLVDIAGLDEARTALDHDVQAAARRAVEKADVVVGVFGPRTHPEDRPSPLATPKGRGGQIAVATMADIGNVAAGCDVNVSAVTGEGLEALRRLIAERVADRGVSVGAEMLALQPRHERALREARECLAGIADLTQAELIAAALRGALDELAGLGGAMTPDDVIGLIFSKFCIGK